MDLKQTEELTQEPKHNELTEKIIGCAYAVSNSLGSGFLEKNYENALVYELEQAGLKVVQQKAIKIHYKGILVGEYVADILVNDKILLELKSAKSWKTRFLPNVLTIFGQPV